VDEEKHPRDCCQACGKRMMGGDDTVSKLPSPFSSFHLHYHLDCYLEAHETEWERRAQSASAANESLRVAMIALRERIDKALSN
jgi:hypothetical protein